MFTVSVKYLKRLVNITKDQPIINILILSQIMSFHQNIMKIFGFLHHIGICPRYTLYIRHDRLMPFFSSQKNPYPKFLVAQNCIKKNIEIYFFCFLLVQSNICQKKFLLHNRYWKIDLKISRYLS